MVCVGGGDVAGPIDTKLLLLVAYLKRHVRAANSQLRNKKADVAKHPKAFQYVGLLFNKPAGTASLTFS